VVPKHDGIGLHIQFALKKKLDRRGDDVAMIVGVLDPDIDAAALPVMFERDVMLLDEPFGALDALTRALMQRWLLEVWEGAKRTVLFITHDIDEAIFLGDRVLVMSARPGHIKAELQVPLPRPREPDVLTSPAFVDMKRTLLAAVEDESRKAFAATNLQQLQPGEF
jgi:ABC-type proline/glycine betaine transport system ATPase subunit